MPCNCCGRRLFGEMEAMHWNHVFADPRLNALRDAAETLEEPNEFAPDWIEQRSPAARVIDCVLSLNRDYNKIVVPRLNRFERNCPLVRTVTELQATIAQFPGPEAFMSQTLHYDHPDRANTLSGVVNWLVPIAGEGLEQEQLPRLTQWAVEARPSNYRDVHVRGFGLAGFQYLRMLFGACTIKPDVYVLRFVRRQLGRCSPENSIALLEALARSVGLCARHLDLTIWEAERDQANHGVYAPGPCAPM